MSPTTLVSDADLVRAARDGDPDAIRQLLDRHMPSVAAVCRQRLRSTSDVEDATQETAERAIRSLSSLRDPDAVGAWMRGIAVRTCREAIRTRTRGPVSLPTSHLPDGGSPADDVEERLLRSAEAQDLRERLGTLNDRDRLALWWRDALGVPVGEVAEELGVTDGSARVLLSRARDRLRESFEGAAAAIGGVRLSFRGFVERAGRDAPAVDWTSIAQATAAVAAATVMVLPGGADDPTVTVPSAPVVNVAFEPASASPPVVADDPADGAADRARQARLPARSDARQAPLPDRSGTAHDRRIDGGVGPVRVTNEEPDDDPELTIGIEDAAGDTSEAVLHAGDLPIPEVDLSEPVDTVLGVVRDRP